MATIEKNLRGAVDEYLAFCEAEGKTPNVPFKGSLNIRLTKDLHHRVTRFAEEHDQKLNSVVHDAVQHHLAHAA